ALLKVHGMPIFGYGTRVAGGVPGSRLAGSGDMRFPDAKAVRSFPTSYRHVDGHYTSVSGHPRVFDTQADLDDIARRASIAASFTARRFRALAARVRADLAAKTDWSATYAGCDLEIYLRAFAYEQKPAYGNDRSDEQLKRALRSRADLAPPHGAAIVAARG